MHAKIQNDSILEYPIYNIRQRLPNVSLPADLTDDSVLPPGYVYINNDEVPVFDYNTQKLEEGIPTFKNGKWFRTYKIVSLSSSEIAQNLQQKSINNLMARMDAFQKESDPLFFKAQRGEATIEQWQAKVAEIRARFPDL